MIDKHEAAYLARIKEHGGYVTISIDGDVSLTIAASKERTPLPSGGYAYDGQASVAGIGHAAESAKELVNTAIRHGIMVVDNRTADFEKLYKATICGPMLWLENDPLHPTPSEPRADGTYGALDYAPRDYWVKLHRETGATIHNA